MFPPRRKVRRLDDNVTSASALQPGRQGLMVDDFGAFVQPLQLARDLERFGTTPMLLTANAWRISCRCYKAVLLSSLNKSENAKAAILFDELVGSWAAAQGWACSIHENEPEQHSELVNIERESFDFIVAAYHKFATSPSVFGWEAGLQHGAAVSALAVPIQEAFESELGLDSSSAPRDDCRIKQPESTTMSTEVFDGLVQECRAALRIRKARNDNGAYPLEGTDPEERGRAVELYRNIVEAAAPVIADFPRLAAAAVKHVERHEEGQLARGGPDVINSAVRPVRKMTS